MWIKEKEQKFILIMLEFFKNPSQTSLSQTLPNFINNCLYSYWNNSWHFYIFFLMTVSPGVDFCSSVFTFAPLPWGRVALSAKRKSYSAVKTELRTQFALWPPLYLVITQFLAGYYWVSLTAESCTVWSTLWFLCHMNNTDEMLNVITSHYHWKICRQH